MTSAQRGRGGPKIPQICGQTVSKFCGQREGRVKKSEKGVDGINGSPLGCCRSCV